MTDIAVSLMNRGHALSFGLESLHGSEALANCMLFDLRRMG